jgi:tight adherence protein C
MADFFDMTNLAIEAGMGLDQALSKVCKQMKGPLSEEFLTTLEDMKLGKSREDALYDLRNRIVSVKLK